MESWRNIFHFLEMKSGAQSMTNKRIGTSREENTEPLLVRRITRETLQFVFVDKTFGCWIF